MIDLKALPAPLKAEILRNLEAGKLTVPQALDLIKGHLDREAEKAPRRTAAGFSKHIRGTGNVRRAIAAQGFAK